jgi:hypothetical protein
MLLDLLAEWQACRVSENRIDPNMLASENLKIFIRLSCSLLSPRGTLEIKEGKNRVEVDEEVNR